MCSSSYIFFSPFCVFLHNFSRLHPPAASPGLQPVRDAMSTWLVPCLAWAFGKSKGLMAFFLFPHVSQLAENNLHATSGPRRRPTCWAAHWRNSPPASLSTRPRARCLEPARSARRLTRMAQPIQVFRTFYLCCTRLRSLTLAHTHSHAQHVDWHASVCSSPQGNCRLNSMLYFFHAWSNAYLCGE